LEPSNTKDFTSNQAIRPAGINRESQTKEVISFFELKISTRRRKGHVKLDLFRREDLWLLKMLKKLFKNVGLGSNQKMLTKMRIQF
jgi:hypothetical protein